MPKGPTGQKRPGDVIGIANTVGEIATGDIQDEFIAGKEYVQKGGLKGGVVRASRLTPDRWKEIAAMPPVSDGTRNRNDPV